MLLFGDKYATNTPDIPKKKKSDVQLSERLASFGVTGVYLRAPLEPLEIRSFIILRGSSRILNLTPLCRVLLASQTAEIYFSFS